MRKRGKILEAVLYERNTYIYSDSLEAVEGCDAGPLAGFVSFRGHDVVGVRTKVPLRKN